SGGVTSASVGVHATPMLKCCRSRPMASARSRQMITSYPVHRARPLRGELRPSTCEHGRGTTRVGEASIGVAGKRSEACGVRGGAGVFGGVAEVLGGAAQGEW